MSAPAPTPRVDSFIAGQEAAHVSIWAALINLQDLARTLERDRDRLAAQVKALREALETIAELEGDTEGQKFKLTRFQASQVARKALSEPR